MIKDLEGEFKSVKHLKLDCKKINVFIGEPNTGKSNILESLGILSFACYTYFRRFKVFYMNEEFIKELLETLTKDYASGNLFQYIKNRCVRILTKDYAF